MPSWDPNQYLKFADERTRPAVELLGRVPIDHPKRVIDLGCGPANSTALLKKRWPKAEVTGLDRAPEMLAAAREKYPKLKWIESRIESWESAKPFDLVFSNAALQWVPDHAALFPRLFGQVAPGGVLAIQMPANQYSPVHLILREVAKNPAWEKNLQNAARAIHVEAPIFYYDLFASLASRVDLWETEYQHVMKSAPAILEWVRGTALRPYLEALTDEDQQRHFEQLVLARIEEQYPRRGDRKVLFPFRRLFLVAVR
jgi:trans-aconitate 2-methyltransferase